MTRTLLIMLIACAVPRLAAAQGLLLQKGTSGYGANAGLATDGGYLSLSGEGGYSYNGWVDASFSAYRTAFDPDRFYGQQLSAYGLVPRLAVHPLKQSDTMPLSVAVGTSFGVFSIVDEDYDYEAMANGWSLRVDTTLYRFFRLGKNYGVIPGVTLAYTHTQLNMDGDAEHEDAFAVGLGGHLAWLNDKGWILTITPGLAIDSFGAVSFVVNVGAIRAQQ